MKGSGPLWRWLVAGRTLHDGLVACRGGLGVACSPMAFGGWSTSLLLPSKSSCPILQPGSALLDLRLLDDDGNDAVDEWPPLARRMALQRTTAEAASGGSPKANNSCTAATAMTGTVSDPAAVGSDAATRSRAQLGTSHHLRRVVQQRTGCGASKPASSVSFRWQPPAPKDHRQDPLLL